MSETPIVFDNEALLEGVWNNHRTSYSYDSEIKGLPLILFNNFVVLDNNGLEKTISLEDFYGVISKRMLDRMTIENSMLLPRNTYITAFSPTSCSIGCYFPEVKRVLRYSKGGNRILEFTVPFPNTVLSFHLTRNNVSNTWSVVSAEYYITPLPLIELPNKVISSKGSNMFGMPFNNFYADGGMCFGGNGVPKALPLDNIRGLQYYYDIIFDSPFNSDLGIKGVNNASQFSSDNSKYYEYLSTLETFPYETLTGNL